MRGFLFINVFITMKYIITESRLHTAMIRLFGQYINIDEIQRYNPIEETTDGEEYEDTNKTVFYVGDGHYFDSDEEVFRYYECDYFNEDAYEVLQKCPLLTLDSSISDTFNGLFDDLWIEPFRQWINNEFDLNAKVVE